MFNGKLKKEGENLDIETDLCQKVLRLVLVVFILKEAVTPRMDINMKAMGCPKIQTQKYESSKNRQRCCLFNSSYFGTMHSAYRLTSNQQLFQ